MANCAKYRHPKIKSSVLTCCIAMGIFLMPFYTTASTIYVSSIAALQTAINSAAPGDVLVLADNTYLDNVLHITTSNITVRAATAGRVFLNGSNAITISGNHVTFSGFQFTAGNTGGIAITVTGNYNLVTQLNFNGYAAQKYITLQGQYDEIAFCNFENKPTSAAQGNLVHISPNASVPNYASIRYCSFKNMPGAGGDNGNECIRIANGAQSAYLCRTIVEYCYFENTGNGDSEAISVKCRENTLRFNTFKNNQHAMMVFRNGNDNIAYGNFFINAGGIRIKEANNIFCYNNYFENAGVGGTTNAVTYDYVSPNLQNINFIHNSFVECGLIEFSTGGASNNTWANNVFKKSTGNIFAGSATGITWAGNIYQGNTGITINAGMTNADPLLTINEENYYGLSSLSPCINQSSAAYPALPDIDNIDDDPSLSFDISGQSRSSVRTEKDAGCDEYTDGNKSNHPLSLPEVGPSYLGGPGLSPNGVCPASNVMIHATIPGSNYRWQVDTGNGYVDIVNDPFYSGAATSILKLNHPPTSWYGHRYRCLVDNNVPAAETMLKFSVEWLGLVSSAWENPLNWNCGILPDDATDVIINSIATYSPQVNSTGTCRSIRVSPATTITIKTGSQLIITK